MGKPVKSAVGEAFSQSSNLINTNLSLVIARLPENELSFSLLPLASCLLPFTCHCEAAGKPVNLWEKQLS
jgi:hypothetical protein